MGSLPSVLGALDARLNVHVPTHVPSGPYTVIRTRTQRAVFTSVTAQNTVLLLGAHCDNALGNGIAITPLIGIEGVGTNVPGTTESNVIDSLVNTYGGTIASSTASAALHAMTVVVTCIDSALSASGQIYTGTLSNRVARSNYATFNALALDLITRRELKPRSAYQTMTKAVTLFSGPLDVTDWSLHKPLVSINSTLGNNVTVDTIAPIVIVFPPTASVLEYSVTIYCEWRMIFHTPLLASTHTHHAPAPAGFWSNATRLVGAVGGDLEHAVGGVAQAATTLIGPAMQTAVSTGLGIAAEAGARALSGRLGIGSWP